MNTADLNVDKLIERYTSGAMSPSDERAFLTRAGNDPALRELLNAEQSIQSAFTKDRTELFTHSSGAYQRFLARTGQPSQSAIDGVGSSAERVVSGGFVQYAAVILGTIGLSVATFFVGMNLSDSTDTSSPIPEPVVVTSPAVTNPQQTQATMPATESQLPQVRSNTTSNSESVVGRTGRGVSLRSYPLQKRIDKPTGKSGHETLKNGSVTEKKLPVVQTNKARGTISVEDENKK